MTRATSEHSLDVAEPRLPSIRHVDWKTVSREGHGRDRRRRRRCQKGIEGGGEMETHSDKEAVGPGGDTLKLNDPGQVFHRSFSFLICTMGLIPDLCQENE